MSDASLPVLYSFRRCPYAIRARLALRYSGIKVALREVDLGDKPPEMLAASPKGTVPVLLLNEGREQSEVIDESLDVMLWALAQNDPDGWLDIDMRANRQLIDTNDDQFKHWLDRYKYPEYFKELEPGEARGHCETFLQQLEQRLDAHNYLCGDTVSAVDMALYSFVRQFAFVDIEWFAASSLVAVNRWLNNFLEGELFASVMEKYPQWHAGDKEPVV
jgi:glutathione S-transferase